MPLTFTADVKLEYEIQRLRTTYEFPGYTGTDPQLQRQELNGYNSTTEAIGRFDSATKTYLTDRTRYGIVSNDGTCPELCIDLWIYPA